MSDIKHTLLVIDSQLQTQKMLALVLDSTNFHVISCATGKEALQMSISTKPNLVLLDLNLSDMDGVQLIAAMRQWTDSPIIILTERTAEAGIIEALNAGAADYITKPFSMDILEARIKANLRQSAMPDAEHTTGEAELNNGPLHIDLMRHQVWLDKTLISLTPKEYDLLKYMMLQKGKMLLHQQILKAVWGLSQSDNTQYLRVFIGQLRKKLEKNPDMPVLITTEVGIGYRMEIIYDMSVTSKQAKTQS